MTENPIKKKVEKELKVKEFFELDGKVYFKSINENILWLPKNYYYDRKQRLREYFDRRTDLDPNKKERLILENLGLFAKPISDKIYDPKFEVVYQSNAVSVIKESNYSPEDDFKEIPQRYWKGLRDPRTGELIEEQESPWRTKRNDWLWEFGKKIRDKLRKELVGD